MDDDGINTARGVIWGLIFAAPIWLLIISLICK